MFCPNCGTQCPDGERFCPSCGAALEQSQPAAELDITPNQAEPAAESGKKAGRKSAKKPPQISHKVIGIAAVALAAVVVIVLAVSLLGGSGGSGSYGSYTSSPILTLYDTDEGEQLFYCGGKEIGAEEANYTTSWCQDGSVGVFTNYDGELCVVTSKGIDAVADDVISYQLSANGAALLYVTEDYDVYWYNMSKKSGEKLATGEDYAQLGQVAPDGSAAVFTLLDGSDYEGFTCASGKKPVSLGDDIVPFAISNKGSYVYYLKVKSNGGSGTLYVSKGGKSEGVKLASDYYMDSVLFNSDATQMLFNDGGKTYLTVKGGEKEKVLSSSLYSMLTPDYTVGSTGGVVPVSDLRGQTYYTSGGIYFLNSKGESKKITSSFDGMALSANGSSLIYQKNDDLIKVTNLAKGTEEDLTDDAEIRSFRATSDLSAVFYLNRDGELYYQKGSGKPVEVGDDVDAFLMAPDGKTCVIISDGELFTSTGKAMAAVKDVEDDSSFSFAAQRGVLLISQSAGGRSEVNIYTMSGSTPKLLVEDFEGYLD